MEILIMRLWLAIPVLATLAGCADIAGLLFAAVGPKADAPRLMQRQVAETVQGLDPGLTGTLESLQRQMKETRHFRFDVQDFTPEEKALANVAFPDCRSAIAYAEAKGEKRFLPSADLVGAVLKQVNDGLYARMELALERGEGGLPAKSVWIRKLLDTSLKDLATPSQNAVASRLAGSLILTGETPTLPVSVQTDTTAALADFDKRPALSLPLGFYAWTSDLQKVFRRDRWLQTWGPKNTRAYFSVAEAPVAAADTNLVDGLTAAAMLDPDSEKAIKATNAVYEVLTNNLSGYTPADLLRFLPTGKTVADALVDPSVRQAMLRAILADPMEMPSRFWALLPPSAAAETALFERLKASGKIRNDADLMQVLIDAVRQGTVSLQPKAESGFYAYQQHALEALLNTKSLPEGKPVIFGDRYLKRLEEAFKSGLTLARETHVKQLDSGCGWFRGCPKSVPPPPPKPSWVIEPLPTHYERLANAYQFLETRLLPLMSPAFVAEAKILQEGGADGDQSIGDAIRWARQLNQGLAILAKAEIGIEPVANASETETAATWIRQIGQDPRLSQDVRFVVPIDQYQDQKDVTHTKYWGTAGVTLYKVQIRFDKDEYALPTDYVILANRFIAFERTGDGPPLTRDAFRRVLDQSTTLEEAKQRLAAG
jgi:hypothetical protein